MNSQTQRLIIVTGRPGAGKTTLSRHLIHAVGQTNSTTQARLLCRDDYKRSLLEEMGVRLEDAPKNIDQQATKRFWQDVLEHLDQDVVVADAEFQHKLWEQLLSELPVACIRMIVCHIDPNIALQRYQKRLDLDESWQRIHGSDIPTGLIRGYESPQGEWRKLHLDMESLDSDPGPLVDYCLD